MIMAGEVGEEENVGGQQCSLCGSCPGAAVMSLEERQGLGKGGQGAVLMVFFQEQSPSARESPRNELESHRAFPGARTR